MATVAKTLRKIRGLQTKADFARSIGIARSAVTKWEAGEGFPDIVSLAEIRNVYGDDAVIEILKGVL